MGVAHDHIYARHGCEFFRGALRVAAGDYDSCSGILPADPADCGAGVLISACRDRAGIQDYDGRLCRSRSAREPLVLELTFDGGAVGLCGAASEVFNVVSGHIFILAQVSLRRSARCCESSLRLRISHFWQNRPEVGNPVLDRGLGIQKSPPCCRTDREDKDGATSSILLIFATSPGRAPHPRDPLWTRLFRGVGTEARRDSPNSR